MNNNELTYKELSKTLAEFQITDIPEEKLENLENRWSACPEEVKESMDKMTVLLSVAGMGNYDYKTGKWTPTSKVVYSFDMEAFDIYTMYGVFFKGMESITNNLMVFTDVVQDEYDSGERINVSFKMNNVPHECKVKREGAWYDLSIINYLNQILAEEGSDKQWYFTTDGYQGISVFYCTAEWATKFMAKTNCTLLNRV